MADDDRWYEHGAGRPNPAPGPGDPASSGPAWSGTASSGPAWSGPAPYGGHPSGAAPYGGYPAGPAPQAPPYGAPTFPPPPPGAFPPPYGQPYGYPYAPPQRTNGLAVASMVLGILWLYWIGSVLALVFGYVARNQIRQRNEGGAGMAVAGIVLGWVGVGLFFVVLLAGIASSV